MMHNKSDLRALEAAFVALKEAEKHRDRRAEETCARAVRAWDETRASRKTVEETQRDLRQAGFKIQAV